MLGGLITLYLLRTLIMMMYVLYASGCSLAERQRQMSSNQKDELTMREVTRENWRATLRLAVHPEQQRFIADTVPIAAIALAKAYNRPGGLLWLPYAFYAQS